MIREDRIVWTNVMWQPQPVMTRVSSLPDELIDRFRETMSKMPRGTGTWYLGCPFLPNMIDEESRGRFRIPRIMVFIDAITNEIIKLQLFGKDLDVLMPLSLIDGLMAGKEIPKTLVVSDDFSEALVSEIVPRLGVEVRRTDSYPDAENAAVNAARELEKDQIMSSILGNASGRRKWK
jgi:hypothetical protein